MTKLVIPQDLGDKARADLADLIDLQLSPLGLPALDLLAPTHGQTILDVGCGAGQTVVQLADRVGLNGRVIGVDIAPRVLAVARARTEHLPQAILVQHDAAKLALPDKSVDGIYSRFGVMAFADPIETFSNLRRMLTHSGRIAFVCWRSMKENELDFLPLEAAGLDAPVDETPFSFENPDVVTNVLRATGFSGIAIEAFDAPVSSGDVAAMLKVVTTVGALGKFLRENRDLLQTVEPQVRAALSARGNETQVSLGAATWIVTAVAE